MSGTSLDASETRVVGRHRLSRYDLLLAVVPLAFVVGLAASGLMDLPVRVGLSSAAAVCAVALIDGLFLNPPRRPSARDGPD